MGLIIKGTCAGCRRHRKVRNDGLIRIHRDKEMWPAGPDNLVCVGSEEPPTENATEQYFCNTGCTGCRDIIKYGM